METVAFQQEFRPALPNVYGALDYRIFRDTLIKIDEILNKTDLEYPLILSALAPNMNEPKIDTTLLLNNKRISNRYKKLKHAFRCNIARHLTGESYRAFSMRLADSTLFQWFTGINDFGCCKATSKSSLERYEKYFDEATVVYLIRQWLSGFSDIQKAMDIGLDNSIHFKDMWMDSTCVKAHIHFPVDWVLLRDAARSLLSAIKTIRAQGLKHRMAPPNEFLKQMNNLCIEMTHTRRRKDSKKQRKTILRKMKKLNQCIAKHARRYRDLVQQQWTDTHWSEAQAKQVISRIDHILEQLPQAIEQAHERIIGGRPVASAKKCLSLYDNDIDVIVRGKAGSEVEFGQRFLLVEQQDGLLIDWQLFSKGAPQDSDLLSTFIKRAEKVYGKIDSISTDRAFSSAKNDIFLKEKNIFNACCPKSPPLLQEKLTDQNFVALQTRRSQTEARIGIFKNVFLGKPLRSRVTLNKRYAINWCVLAHNLWVLSRKTIADEQDKQIKLKKAA